MLIVENKISGVEIKANYEGIPCAFRREVSAATVPNFEKWPDHQLPSKYYTIPELKPVEYLN